jgi:hypothetical protein
MKYTPANPIVIIFKRDGIIVDFALNGNGKIKVYAHYPRAKTLNKLGEGWTAISSVALPRTPISHDVQHLLRGICL